MRCDGSAARGMSAFLIIFDSIYFFHFFDSCLIFFFHFSFDFFNIFFDLMQGTCLLDKDWRKLDMLMCVSCGYTCICHHKYKARRRDDEGLGSLPFAACGDECAPPRS